MTLKNTSGYPNWFMRRMTSWCANQVGLPASKIRRAVYRTKSHRAFSGQGGSGWITVSVGPDKVFPTPQYKGAGIMWPAINDRLEAWVAVIGHELTHVKLHLKGVYGAQEHAAKWGEDKCLAAFRAGREALLAVWNKAPAYAAPKVSANRTEFATAIVKALPPTSARPAYIKHRALKAQQNLARWERKLKLAKTKVSKLKAKVKYYEDNSCKRNTAA